MKTLVLGFICIMMLHVVSCSRDPNDWKLIRAARAEEPVTFHIALHQRNTDLLEKHLFQISDPNHPRYGEVMSRDEIITLVAPPKEDHDAVVAFFKSYGTDVDVHSFGDALKITAPSRLVERMLKTRLFKYQHKVQTHMHAIRHVGGFTIPTEISNKIYMVTGLTMFPYVTKDTTNTQKDAFGTDILAQAKRQAVSYPYVSISNVRSVYNVPEGTAATSRQTTQVSMQFSPVTAPNNYDLQEFCQMSNEVYTNISKTYGPYYTNNPNYASESTWSTELMMGLGTNVTNWYYTVTLGWIWEMSLELFNLQEVPQVVSIAFASEERHSCDASGVYCGHLTVAQWVNRTNIELMKLGLRRVTLLAGSGNKGASNRDYCTNTNPINPMYPASSPYVTSIGATTFLSSTSDAKNMKRDAAQDSNDIPICLNGYDCVSGPVTEWPSMANISAYSSTTGGGFSFYAKTPPYQTTAVQQYLNTPNIMLPPSVYFNSTNRGYPDFSIVGDRLLTIQNGYISVASGMEVSTPLAAAMIALLNDARAQNNKAPLGFFNLALYQMYNDNPEIFNDITMGDNHCSYNNCGCPYGYGATKGWDAVTGLGTPNFAAMSKYVVVNLP